MARKSNDKKPAAKSESPKADKGIAFQPERTPEHGVRFDIPKADRSVKFGE